MAWQPLTPRGVAAFAQSSFGRLFAVQIVVAMFVVAAVLWLLLAAWYPVIGSAIRALPEKGQIQAGRLQWEGDTATNLAESRFLAVTVDQNHRGDVRSPAHVQIELGRYNCRVISLFGFIEVDYPRNYSVLFNRTELLPWWEAWRFALLAAVALALLLGLWVCWGTLATLYFLPVWLGAFYANRRLSFFGSWRLAGAALMPGAVFMAGAFVVYSRGFLSLLDLSAAFVLHVIIGWIYLVVSMLSLPPALTVEGATVNPFQPGASSSSPPVQQDACTDPASGRGPSGVSGTGG